MSSLAEQIIEQGGLLCADPVALQCVGCGLRPWHFCDRRERACPDGRWRGTPCLAVDRVGAYAPESQLAIPAGQRTPLCTVCSARAVRLVGVENCHFCMGQPWATAPASTQPQSR